MAKQDALTNEQKEIVRAQNDALLFLPDNRDDRLALILNYRREKARENDLIAQAKKDSGAGETLKTLMDQRKLKKQAISIINTLAEMEASARAIAVRQVISYAEDFNWVIPDLFDAGAVGQQAPAAEADKAVFDSTSEGQRRGGSKAEPRQAPEPAPEAKPREIPTLSVDDAQKAYDVELAKRDGKRGPEPKALKEARAALEMAKALEAEKAKQGEGQPAAPETPTGTGDDKVVPFHRQQASANAVGEEHIRQQAEKLAADRAAKVNGTAAAPPPPPSDDDDGDDVQEEVAEAAPEPAPEKPKRGGGRKKAAATSKASPPPPPPPPPPSDDDEDDAEDGAPFPDGAPAVGAHPERPTPDFRIG